jgi:hypothetical protein
LFAAVAVVNVSDGNFTSPEVMAAATAVNFFETLGVPLLLGRSISSREIGVQLVRAIRRPSWRSPCCCLPSRWAPP